MPTYMWMDGVPGRPGLDDWFEIESFSFSGGGTGIASTTVTVRKPHDNSSSAIFIRFIKGPKGPASIWVGNDNDIAIKQIDFTNTLVLGIQSSFDKTWGGIQVISLSFTKVSLNYFKPYG